MVSKSTLKAVSAEYKTYLRELYPDWSENTLKVHVSDAFYLYYDNEFAIPFWSCLCSEESLKEARDTIAKFLKRIVKSEQAAETAAAYYHELYLLKTFLDEKYGGVEKRVGVELDAESEIYQISKLVDERKLSVEKGISLLCERVPCCSESSHKAAILMFSCMRKGSLYTRRSNLELTGYFLTRIAKEYGVKGLSDALSAAGKHILSYYEQTGNRSGRLRRMCAFLADQYGITLPSFDDSMFAGITPRSPADAMLSDHDIDTVHYWLYSPGDGAAKWDEFYQTGIMAIGWDCIGDLEQYATKDEMKEKMKECYGSGYSYKNAAHATWQFAYQMKIGDIVFVKKGLHTIVGRGVVISDYMYDPAREEYQNIRKVGWTDAGEWEHPGQAAMKTLTDITAYTDYVAKLDSLFERYPEDVEEADYPAYTKEDFLKEVYLEEEDYETLTALLQNKKNLILQGAPGVGKTYAAKRLAYARMGVKDTQRVSMVQFHQSYSYEDFIMGFRPSGSGFELRKGPFYEFCKKAEIDNENDYFFLIDEINRGNLSKIFGELFMLIESDKRGVQLQLLYSDELFSVPENVYLIGTMNTADRSLAMLDYALRRRFSFFELSPAFDSKGFGEYRAGRNHAKFDRLISEVKRLNREIEEDETLGRGFRIGHSYFCTASDIDDAWLKALVNYELIPLLEEYWFDEPAKVNTWSLALRRAIE